MVLVTQLALKGTADTEDGTSGITCSKDAHCGPYQNHRQRSEQDSVGWVSFSPLLSQSVVVAFSVPPSSPPNMIFHGTDKDPFMALPWERGPTLSQEGRTKQLPRSETGQELTIWGLCGLLQ